ncbi:hypothetical protein HYH02_010681 [Chlamydomonas schloesseri]|uniref:Protein kinase domain-containing protein n=1 Tax=Chlamydomonas schloesseri TaxID=2026947 RepID=A0A835W6E9_9CHLO|nr:hypothetical protein HYH02_010681 [Chlamydomonas schloesseri]|eukprot:KAG2438884.1 hypothetical protein HYH02_010681 [Chlamydomonas schloesseri]
MRSAHSGSCLPQLQLDEPAAASSGAEPNTGNSSIFNGLHTPGHPQESILGYGCTTAASSKEGGSGGNATLTSPAAADTAGRAAAGPAHQPPQQQAPLWPMPPPQQPPRRTSAFGRNKTTRIGLLTTNFNDPRPSLLSPPSLASPNDAASDAGPCSSLSIATSSIHQSMLFSPYSPGSSIPASAATPALSSYDVGSAAACFGSGASAAAAAAGVKCSSKATAAAVPRTAADGRVTLATLLASPATSPAPSPRTSATSTKPSEVLRQGTPAAVDVTAVEEAMEDISAAGGVAPLRTVKTNNAARTTAPATPAAPSAAAPLSPLPSLVSQQPSPAVEAAAAAAPPTPSAATAAARPAVAGGDWTELPEREHPFMADLRKVEAVLFVASPKAAAPAAPAPAAAAPAPSSGGSTGSVHPWVLEVEEGAAVRSSAPASSGCGRRAPEVTSPHACAATSQDSPAPPASATPPLPPPSPALAPPRQQPQSSPAPQQPQSLASPLPRATQAARRPSASPAAAVAPPAAAAASPAAAAAAPPRPLMRPLLPPRVLPEDRSLYVSEGAPAEMLQNARAAVAGQRVAWSLADFEILKTLHEGYASSVFRARCLVSGALVVLKVYNLEDQTSFLRYQMLRELHIHARLRHQNIVPLFGSFRDDCALVMVQQYVHGGSLSQLRRGLACGRMTEFQVMHLVVIPLLNALVYLHRHGIVHRDIKPANLLFTSDWQLKLCDFGVSICLHEERAVTRTGSADYMAPEVTVCPLKHLPEDHKGNASMAYTSAVDVWSVGVLVYDMLVGFTPFPSGMSRVRATAGDSEPADKLHFPSSVGEPARAFVRACLRLNPADRPTVQELRRHEWVTKALDDVS